MDTTRSPSWHGEEEHSWTSGGWAVVRRGDEIANVTFAGVAVLRALRFVIRDENWQTPGAAIDLVDVSDDGLRIDAHYVLDDIDVAARVRLKADASTLTFAVDAVSASAFWTQRVGLVAQQPPGLAGTELIVVHPDTAATTTTFPDRIRPHQPAKEIRELAWTTQQLPVQMLFDGGLFEMEDQRNWTDASYKTYTPPLSSATPFQTFPGQRWRQSIAITVADSVVDAIPEPTRAERIKLVPAGRKAPAIGVQASTAPDSVRRTTTPPVQFLLVELDAAAPNWREALARAAGEGAPLDVRIITDDVDSVAEVVDAIKEHSLVRVGVFATRTHVTELGLWHALRTAVDRAGLDVGLVGGARTHYTELNLNHDRMPAFPAYAFSITPQMHVHETAQLVESIPMQHTVARDAALVAANAAVHVGPITLRPRVNAVAISPPPAEHADLLHGYGPQLVAGSSDGRQAEPMTATWTVASAAALGAAGAASLTYFETWGPRGLQDDAGNQLPVWDAIKVLAELSGAPLLVQEGITPGTKVWALGVKSGDSAVVVLANLTGDEIRLEVEAGETSGGVGIPAWGWTTVTL